MDKASISGLLLAITGILAGLLLEGGSISQVIQPTAAMIVLGGTIGAVLLQYPMSTIQEAFRSLSQIFLSPKDENLKVVGMLVGFASKARRLGLVSLDRDLDSVQEPFLRQALTLAVDGSEPEELRKIMSLTQDARIDGEDRVPAVFESAGGFAPTFGILGAVLGLIQVMQHLDRIEQVGKGIAVAFVATIYGVGAANLFFLPIAGKLRIRIREEQQRREMMLEGVISILEGINPRMLQTKLSGFLETVQQVTKEAA